MTVLNSAMKLHFSDFVLLQLKAPSTYPLHILHILGSATPS